MCSVGDRFPDQAKQEYADRCLRPGQVLYLFTDFLSPPKDKYLVLAYRDTRPLLFFINSRVSRFLANHPDLSQCQVEVRASDYSFLNHDSYINCGEVIDYFTESEIRDQIVVDISRVKGELSSATKKTIIGVVKGARTISDRNKELIVDSLSSE